MSDEKLARAAFWTFWGGAAATVLGFALEQDVLKVAGGLSTLGGLVAGMQYMSRNPYSASPLLRR